MPKSSDLRLKAVRSNDCNLAALHDRSGRGQTFRCCCPAVKRLSAAEAAALGARKAKNPDTAWRSVEKLMVCLVPCMGPWDVASCGVPGLSENTILRVSSSVGAAGCAAGEGRRDGLRHALLQVIRRALLFLELQERLGLRLEKGDDMDCLVQCHNAMWPFQRTCDVH